MAYGSFSYQLSSESSNEARKAAPGKFLRFPARLRQVAVRFLCKAEIAGALDANFLCHFEDLANDVEIVSLRFFVDHAVKVFQPCNSLILRARGTCLRIAAERFGLPNWLNPDEGYESGSSGLSARNCAGDWMRICR